MAESKIIKKRDSEKLDPNTEVNVVMVDMATGQMKETKMALKDVEKLASRMSGAEKEFAGFLQAITDRLGQKEPEGNVSIKRDGDQIILPPDMSIDEGIKWLQRKKIEEENVVAVHEVVDAYPLDGAYALAKVVAQRFGWTNLIPTPGFFGDSPPNMVGIEVAPQKTVQVPWGRMQFPILEGGFLSTDIAKKDQRPVFVISGEIKRKHQAIVSEIAAEVRQLIKAESVYKGKAIRVVFPEKDERFDPTKCPTFLELGGVREEELIFPEPVMHMVRDNLFTLVERTEECRQAGIPLKRGILLEGKHGTGKTLTAFVTAKKAQANGWTFILIDSVAKLQPAIQFALQYAPAVVFAEDIDRVLQGERDEDMDAILNTIDGIESKGKEVLVALTTNHVDKINPAMLRPGRLDAVISVTPPDEHAVQTLIRLYGRGLVDEHDDLTAVGQKLKGHIPAVIREVMERAKLSCISRKETGAPLILKAVDLEHAADGMLAHLKLMEGAPEDHRSPVEVLGRAMGDRIAEGMVQHADKLGAALRNGKDKSQLAEA